MAAKVPVFRSMRKIARPAHPSGTTRKFPLGCTAMSQLPAPHVTVDSRKGVPGTGVNAPSLALIEKASTYVFCGVSGELATYRYFPCGSVVIASAQSTVEKGEPGTGLRDPLLLTEKAYTKEAELSLVIT